MSAAVRRMAAVAATCCHQSRTPPVALSPPVSVSSLVASSDRPTRRATATRYVRGRTQVSAAAVQCPEVVRSAAQRGAAQLNAAPRCRCSGLRVCSVFVDRWSYICRVCSSSQSISPHTVHSASYCLYCRILSILPHTVYIAAYCL